MNIIKKITAGLLAAGAVWGAMSVAQADDMMAPAKVTSGGSSIYGMLVYTDSYDAPLGLYELTKSGAMLKWENPDKKYDFYSGWLKDGKLCGYGEDRYYSQLRGLNYMEIDFETGRLISSQEIALTAVHYDIATYNPSDNTIYGFGKASDGKYAFMKSSPAAPTETEVIKNVDYDKTCVSLTYCPVDGMLYGVNRDYPTKFIKIDMEGNMTDILTITTSSDISEYVTGLVYSPVEKVFYWNRYEGFDDFKSQLTTINIETKKIENLRTYPNVEQFACFVTTDEYVEEGQPAAPTITRLQFNKGALTGVMQATMPTVDVDGNSITGPLTYVVTVDDTEYKTATANAGASVTVTLQNMTQGNHTFAIYVEQNGKRSERAFSTLYVGNDTPLAPAQVTLTTEKASWTAVTEGVNGGYIDAANMKYEVFLNGESKGVTSETSMSGIIDANAPLSFYTATVIAKVNNMSSEPAVSNRILAGTALNMPVELVPTKDEFDLMQCFDLDGDSYSWKCRDGYMESQWTLSRDGGNDWVILPPIKFENANDIYSLSYEAMRNMVETGRETLQVFIGTVADPAQMTTVLVDQYEPLTTYESVDKVFTVPAAGNYYIAFKATSMKWESGIETGIRVRNIQVGKSSLNGQSPAAVTNLAATRAAKGELKATVTFNLPSVTYNGTALDASATVTAVVTGDNEVTVTGKPGEQKSVTVQTRQGQNTIKVLTKIGANVGAPATVSVYTGVVAPGMAQNLTFGISDDMMSVTLNWEAPAEENAEGYVNPAGVYYRVYEAIQSFYDSYWELKGETQPGETTFTFTHEGDTQKSHTLAVMALNVAGNCDDLPGGEVLLGKPYDLPMLDDFENGYDYFQYGPWLQYQPDETFTGRWSVWPAENVVVDGTGNVLVSRPTEGASKACIGVPAVTTAGDGGAAISFDVLMNVNTPVLEVRAIGQGVNDEVVVGKLTNLNTDEMTPVTFNLPAKLGNASWVQLYFYTTFSRSTEMLIVDNVQVYKTDGSSVTGVITDEVFDIYAVSGLLIKKDADKADLASLPAGIYICRGANGTAKLNITK